MKEKDKIKNAKVFLRSSIVDIVLCIVAVIVAIIFIIIEAFQGHKSVCFGIGSVIRACCCVAKGDFNLAIFPGTKHKNCDIAAVKVIVEEAGGKVTDLFGNEQLYNKGINGAIISNGLVHDEVIGVVKKYLKNKNSEEKIWRF